MARLTVLSALAIGVVLASCVGDITSSNGATATLSVVTAQSTDGPLAATAAADSVVVILSGPTDRRVSGVPGESVRIDGLPVGTYTVRLEAYSGSLLIWDGEDTVSVSANATATATIVPNVLEHLPIVTITEPLSDVTVAFDAIVLTGSASDVEDGDLTASIVWSSDQDGPLGTGGSLTPTLSVGVHVISATVQDQAGQSVSAAVTVTSAESRRLPELLTQILHSAVFASVDDDPDRNYAVPADTDLLVVFAAGRDDAVDSPLSGVSLSTDGALTEQATNVSRVQVGGNRITGGVFTIASPTAGAQTLRATWSGTAPERRRLHIYALSGTGLFVRDLAFDDDANDEGFRVDPARRVTVASQIGDLVLDYIAWRDSDVAVASIGSGQTQELADGSAPVLQNGSSKPGEASFTTMEVTGDSGSATNVFLYYAVSIGQDQGALATDAGERAGERRRRH